MPWGNKMLKPLGETESVWWGSSVTLTLKKKEKKIDYALNQRY